MDTGELRLAVAMNGGVSLAVWIGGATYELWRFARGEGVWPDEGARIDVMSGTSAGGINAAVLAAATLWPDHTHAGGPAIASLRSLWLDDGGLEPVPGAAPLLPRPGAAPSRSLLDGDYFHERLRNAFEQLVPDTPSEQPSRQVDLRLTATSLEGAEDDVKGTFGDVFRNRQHSSGFHLRQNVDGLRDFAWPDPAGPGRTELVDTLAAASRCTASFPFAFEPVDLDEVLPSARGVVDGADTRWMVDGGVLNNLPVDRAVDAIFAMPAEGPVDRYLVVMVPDPPGGPAADPGAPDDGTNVLTDVVAASLAGIPRVQSVAGVLRKVTAVNTAVDGLRAGRDALLELDLEGLRVAADGLWGAYRRNRRTLVASKLARALIARGVQVADPTTGAAQVVTYEEVRQVVAGDPALALPWLPDEWDPAGAAPPCWGAATVQRTAGAVLDLIGRAESAGVGGLGPIRESVHAARSEAAGVAPLDRTLSLAAERVPTQGAGTASSDLSQRLAAAFELYPDADDPAAAAAQRAELASALGTVADALATLAAAWKASDSAPPRLVSEVDDDSAATALLALEVIQTAFRESGHAPEQPVRPALLSPRLGCPIDPQRRSNAKRKLSGDDLGHFGAFLKRSWRANDWMWGRLDAAVFLGELRTHRDPDDSTRIAQDTEAACRAIVRDEAPVIVEAILADRSAGAASPRGTLLLEALGDPTAPVAWDDVRVPRWDFLESPEWEFLGEPERTFLEDPTSREDRESVFLALLSVGDETVAAELGGIPSKLLLRLGARAAARSAAVVSSDQGGILRPSKLITIPASKALGGASWILDRIAR